VWRVFLPSSELANGRRRRCFNRAETLHTHEGDLGTSRNFQGLAQEGTHVCNSETQLMSNPSSSGGAGAQ
jgi:hypothetical protein